MPREWPLALPVLAFIGAAIWWRADSMPTVPGLIIVVCGVVFAAGTVLIYRLKR